MAAIATGSAVEGAGRGFMGLLDALVDTSVPLLAAVNGVAVGLGFTLLAHCDIVLVDAGARLRVPFAELGVPAEAASSLLFPAAMGWQQAARVLLTSDWVDAAELVELGLALRRASRGRSSTRPSRWRRASPPTPAAPPAPSPPSCGPPDATRWSRRTDASRPRSRPCSARRRHTAPWRSSPRRPRPGPDRAPGHHRRAHRSRPGTGRTGRRGRGARLRLALPPRAHPSARARGHAPGAGGRCASRRLQALPRPARRPGDGGCRDVTHRTRHRHPAGRAARPHRPGQAGGDPRPPLGRPGHARGRLRLEPGRGRGPRGRIRPAARRSCGSTSPPWRPSGRPTRPSTTARSSTSVPPGRGRSRCSSRGCAP